MWCTAGIIQFHRSFDLITVLPDICFDKLVQIEVGSLVIETAFRDDERGLAERSAHLHPQRLLSELQGLAGAVDVYVTHIKPGEVDAVMSEVGAQATPHRIRALYAGQRMSVAGGE